MVSRNSSGSIQLEVETSRIRENQRHEDEHGAQRFADRHRLLGGDVHRLARNGSRFSDHLVDGVDRRRFLPSMVT